MLHKSRQWLLIYSFYFDGRICLTNATRECGDWRTPTHFFSPPPLYVKAKQNLVKVSTISHYIQVPRGTRSRLRIGSRSTHRNGHAVRSFLFSVIRLRLHHRCCSIGTSVAPLRSLRNGSNPRWHSLSSSSGWRRRHQTHAGRSILLSPISDELFTG